ncbi:MAG: hypothetical protein ACRD1S_00580 [Vicinamibacterales bacterium]
MTAGKLADLVRPLEGSFLDPAARDLTTKPVMTIVGGRIVYER